MEFKVAVIIGEDVKEMVRLENAMHMYGFTITCFKFTNLNEAIDFVFMQPDPVDYLLVEADKLLLEERQLLKALASLGESPHVVTAVYSKNKAINVTRIKKQLGLHMAVRLPADPYEYICQMGFIWCIMRCMTEASGVFLFSVDHFFLDEVDVGWVKVN